MVESQVIPSVTDHQHIDLAIQAPSPIVFLLTGDLITTKRYIDELKAGKKEVFLHLDLIDGISSGKSVLEFVSTIWEPTGIITTKPNLVKEAKRFNLMTIQRVFAIDHGALQKGENIANTFRPDAIEILPGVVPKLIDKMSQQTEIPIIAGGMIDEKEEILSVLKAGALAASVSKCSLWNIGL